MDILLILTVPAYLAGTAAYAAYLFFQKEYLHRWGFGLLICGFICHCAGIAAEAFNTGIFPVSSLRETLSFAAAALVGVFLAFQYKFNLKILGVYAAPLAAAVMLVSSRIPKEAIAVNPALKSFWLIFHVVIIFMGEAAFALACGIGMMYLLQEHAIKTKTPGFFFRRLPSLDMLDTAGYVCIAAGFVLLTFGLISGFLYARVIWGRLWTGDPKEIWSCIVWLVYAALLHERMVAGWRGRKAAVMSVIGFAVLLFTFFGVNFLLKGHHEEFTRW